MARRGAPALYELMRPGQAPGAESPSAPAPRQPSPRRGPTQPIVFEVPFRWALATVGIVAVLLAVAYGIGVARGRALGSAALPAEAVVAAPQSGSPAASGAGSPTIPSMKQGDAAGTAPKRPVADGRPLPPAANNNVDPRVKGNRYYVLAHPSGEKAPGIVDFCRANGLDAYLVPDDTALFRKIIVLPGYKDASEKNSPEIKALEAAIKRVGAKLKAQARGNPDFADAYPEIFR
jgi:hypothetical protein